MRKSLHIATRKKSLAKNCQIGNLKHFLLFCRLLVSWEQRKCLETVDATDALWGLVPKGLLLPLGLAELNLGEMNTGFPKARLQLQTAGLPVISRHEKELGFESQKSWGSDPWLHPC